jgi:hypothetical protein
MIRAETGGLRIGEGCDLIRVHIQPGIKMALQRTIGDARRRNQKSPIVIIEYTSRIFEDLCTRQRASLADDIISLHEMRKELY